MTDKNRPQRPQSDWFLPAILASGSLDASFGAVRVDLEKKRELILALEHSLCEKKGGASDRISVLIRRAKELEETLSFRMGMLSPDRPGAWFRIHMNQGSGIFSGQVLSEPIFCPFPEEKAMSVRYSLKKFYREGIRGEIPFFQGGSCLWLRLLDLNATWYEIDRLQGAHMGTLSLMSICATPPGFAASHALARFLDNVMPYHQKARDLLDACHEHLAEASEKFFMQERGQGFRFDSFSEPESKTPPRRQASLPRSPKDQSSLRIFNFTSYPDRATLKERYRELAKCWHPDRPTGCEEKFQKLHLAYKHLLQQIAKDA